MFGTQSPTTGNSLAVVRTVCQKRSASCPRNAASSILERLTAPLTKKSSSVRKDTCLLWIQCTSVTTICNWTPRSKECCWMNRAWFLQDGERMLCSSRPGGMCVQPVPFRRVLSWCSISFPIPPSSFLCLLEVHGILRRRVFAWCAVCFRSVGRFGWLLSRLRGVRSP